MPEYATSTGAARMMPTMSRAPGPSTITAATKLVIETIANWSTVSSIGSVRGEKRSTTSTCAPHPNAPIRTSSAGTSIEIAPASLLNARNHIPTRASPQPIHVAACVRTPTASPSSGVKTT